MPKWLHPRRWTNSSHQHLRVPLVNKDVLNSSGVSNNSSLVEPIIGSIQKHVKRGLWNRVDGWINQQTHRVMDFIGERLGLLSSSSESSDISEDAVVVLPPPEFQITPPTVQQHKTSSSTTTTQRRRGRRSKTTLRPRAISNPITPREFERLQIPTPQFPMDNDNQCNDDEFPPPLNPVRWRSLTLENPITQPPKPSKRRRSSVTGQDPHSIPPDPRFTLREGNDTATPHVSFSSVPVSSGYFYPVIPRLVEEDFPGTSVVHTGLSVDVPTIRDPYPEVACPPGILSPALPLPMMMEHIPLGCAGDQENEDTKAMVIHMES